MLYMDPQSADEAYLDGFVQLGLEICVLRLVMVPTSIGRVDGCGILVFLSDFFTRCGFAIPFSF